MTQDTRYAVETILTAVPCDEAGRVMGIHADYKGRCKCPFHGGTHNNLKLYGGNRGFYCFVCHQYGNVIDLVMKYQNVTFWEAVEWLNDTFELHLNLDRKNRFSRIRRANAYAKKNGGMNHGSDYTE